MIGVSSLSGARPFRTSGAWIDGHPLPAASTYRDWKFVYVPSAGAVSAPARR
jgi:hypothetical protein